MIMHKSSKRKSLKTQLSSRIRQEEDGGKIVATNPSMPRRHFVQPLQITTGSHDTLFQWNEKLVIEPFQSGAETRPAKKKAPNEKKPVII